MTDTTVPRSEQYTRPPKNLCRVCGVDFATLTGFDLHRQSWGLDYRSRLVGRCTDPTEMGYVCHNGAWYTPEGYEQALVVGDRLQEARAARGRGSERSEDSDSTPA